MTGDPLHVTNGDSTGETLGRTGLGGSVLSWQDALHEGPVPAGSPSELREARGRFLSECGWGSRREIADELERRDHAVVRALREGRHVVLWFEHDLYDQLQLLQIVALAAATGFEPEQVELISVGSFPGRPSFHGLGELEVAELRSLWPQRVPLPRGVVEIGRRAWDAFRAPEPTGIHGLVAEDTSAMPFLEPALRRLLQEFPDPRTGLSRGERQLLEVLAARPLRPGQAFEASIELEEAPFEGDTWVWRRLAGLATGARPLVATVTGGAMPRPPPLGDPDEFAATAIGLTDAGRAVLAGREDRVELLGIDRWLGGTHLTPAGLWRWDPAAESLERAA